MEGRHKTPVFWQDLNCPERQGTLHHMDTKRRSTSEGASGRGRTPNRSRLAHAGAGSRPAPGGGLLSRRLLADEDLPPAQTLMRPFRVADLVERVKSMLG